MRVRDWIVGLLLLVGIAATRPARAARAHRRRG